MSIRYKKLLKEIETKTYSISKISKKVTSIDSTDGDMLSPSELIDQIDTNLKHLKGQKKILQKAKDGKICRSKFKLNEKTDKKNLRPCKTDKTKCNYKSSQNHKNLRGCMFHTQSFRKDEETYKNTKLIPKLPMTTGQKLERTESSIRRYRHAKLSEEILDYENSVHIQSEKSNKNKRNKKIFLDDCNRALQSANKGFFKKSPDGRMSCDKKEHRKSDHELSRSRNNNLTKTSWPWKSHNVNTIKTKVIDDSTYVCLNNSDEENGYSILTYAGNTGGDKLERENLNKQNSLFKETTSKPVVLLDDGSRQQSSKPSHSIGNKRKSKTNESGHESLLKGTFPQNTVNQCSDTSEYMSHNLEKTWESHTNRERPLCSKFETSHRNHINISANNYRSHYYDHKDPVHTKSISKPLRFGQQRVNQRVNESIIHIPDKSFLKESFLKMDQINNPADEINLKDNSASTLPYQPAELSNSIEIELPENLSKLADRNNDFLTKTPIVKQMDKYKDNLEKNTFKTTPLQTPAISTKISSSASSTPQNKLISSDNEMLQQAFEQKRHSSSFQKKSSQDNGSVTSKSESNCGQNDYELGAISKLNLNKIESISKSIPKTKSSSLICPPKEYETQNVSSKILQKIYASTGNIFHTTQPEQTSNENTSKAKQPLYLKSGTKHNSDVEVLTSSIPSILSSSKLDISAKVSAERKNFDFKSKTYNSQDIFEISFKTEPKIYTPPVRTSFQFESDHTSKGHQTHEKKKPETKHISDTKVSKSFHQTTVNDSELGAIPKHIANEKNLTLRSITNNSSLSLFDLPKIFKISDSHKSTYSNPELNNSTERNFKLSTKKTNNKSEAKVNTSSLLNPYNDSHSITNGAKDAKSSTNFQKIISQQSLPKANKSSASQYLESFWNDKDAVKNIFRASSSKFKQKTNLSSSSKSSHDLNNNLPLKILQVSTSAVELNSDKLEESDVSSRSKCNSDLNKNSKIEESNTELLETNFEVANNFNSTKTKTPDSNMHFTFSRCEEESPSVSLKSKLSNNPTENKTNKYFGQKFSLNSYNSSLNKTTENVNNEKSAFLSDTFEQNKTLKGVTRATSDLLQYLQNRVRDYDERVKIQSIELEKLKNNNKVFEPLTSIDWKRKEDEEKKKSKVLKESSADTKFLEHNGINELMEPLSKKDASDNDVKEENSCHCMFCVPEKSTSDYSEEIPLFTGCECMKEDYYKIMRIAYEK